MTSCSQQRQGCTPHSDVCFGFVSCNLSFTSHHYPHRTSILLLCKRQIRVLAGKEFTINIHQTNDPPLSLKEKNPFTPPHPIMIQLDKQAWLDSLVTVREWYWQTLQGGTVRGTPHAFVFLHTPIFPNNRCNWNGGGGGGISHYWLVHLLFHFSAGSCCQITFAVGTDQKQGSYHLYCSLSLPSFCFIYHTNTHAHMHKFSVLFSLPVLSIIFFLFSLYHIRNIPSTNQQQLGSSQPSKPVNTSRKMSLSLSILAPVPPCLFVPVSISLLECVCNHPIKVNASQKQTKPAFLQLPPAWDISNEQERGRYVMKIIISEWFSVCAVFQSEKLHLDFLS